MLQVISCVWFTSGQEMLDIIDVSIDQFKADILSQLTEPKPPKHFGWSWVIAAMQKHDPKEFFWTVKGEFETFDEAEEHMLSLQETIEFPFQSMQHIAVAKKTKGMQPKFFWQDDMEHVTCTIDGETKTFSVPGLFRIFCDEPVFEVVKQ